MSGFIGEGCNEMFEHRRAGIISAASAAASCLLVEQGI